MKKIIICLGIAVGMCLIAAPAWAPQPQTREMEDSVLERLRHYEDIPEIEWCGDKIFDPAHDDCDPTDNTGTWVSNPPNPTEDESMAMCKAGLRAYTGNETNVRCTDGCQCVACKDGRWDMNEGEECDGSDTSLGGVGAQCKKYYEAKGIVPIPQDIVNATCDDDCICRFCGNGKLDLNEECDPTHPDYGPLLEESATRFTMCYPCDPVTCKCTECGNGVLDTGEECDYAVTDPNLDGHYKKECTPPPNQLLLGCTSPLTDPPGCRCHFGRGPVIDTCGDGIFQPSMGEECSNKEGDPNLDPSLWTDTVHEVTGVDEVIKCPIGQECVFCKCLGVEPKCGNSIKEAGEECEVDIACEDADATCTIDCKCEKEPPPECPPQDCPTPVLGKATCSISIDGYSSPGHQKIIEGWNERFHDIIEGNEKIDPGTDFVAEAGFSTVQIMLRAKDTVAQDVAKFAGGKAQTTNGVSYGRWAWIALSGTPPIDFKTRKFKPPTKVYIDKPTRIFPLSSTDIAQAGATKEMAGVPKGLKAIELPDLSAGLSGLNLDLTTPVEIDNVATTLGGEDLNIQVSEDLEWKLNNVVSLKLQPGMSLNKATATEGVGDMVVLWRAIVEPDRASWTGPEGRPVLMPGEEWKDLYIENRKLSIQAAMDHVEQNIQACYPDCDCSAFLGSDYEENLHYQYAFVQDTVAPEQTGLGKSAGTGTNTAALGVAHIAMIGGVGRGGGGCQCSVNSVVPSASHLILMIGIAASGLAGIIAVRRRKR